MGASPNFRRRIKPLELGPLSPKFRRRMTPLELGLELDQDLIEPLLGTGSIPLLSIVDRLLAGLGPVKTLTSHPPSSSYFSTFQTYPCP